MISETETLKEVKIPKRDRKLCPTLICEDESLTEQSHKEQTDINLILKDYRRTGFIAHAKKHQGQYDDVSAVDFQNAMDTIANTKSMFEALPSAIRAEFGNDTISFLNYVQNPANASVLEQRGILVGNDGINIHGAIVDTPTPNEVRQSSKSPEEVPSLGAQEQTSDSAG